MLLCVWEGYKHSIVAPVVKVVELNVMPICVGVKKKQKCVHPVFRKRYHGGAIKLEKK